MFSSSMKEIFYKHVKSEHGGKKVMKLPCEHENCDYVALVQSKLTEHVNAKHLGIIVDNHK